MDRIAAALERHLTGKQPNWPEGSDVIVAAFAALSAARTGSSAGPNPIAYADIAAWASLHRMPLEPSHVRCIAAMDQIWLRRAREVHNLPEGVKVAPHVSEHPLTAAMFDLAVG